MVTTSGSLGVMKIENHGENNNKPHHSVTEAFTSQDNHNSSTMNATDAMNSGTSSLSGLSTGDTEVLGNLGSCSYPSAEGGGHLNTIPMGREDTA